MRMISATSETTEPVIGLLSEKVALTMFGPLME